MDWERYSDIQGRFGVFGTPKVCPTRNGHFGADVVERGPCSGGVNAEHEVRQGSVGVNSTGEAPGATAIVVHALDERSVLRCELATSCKPNDPPRCLLDRLTSRPAGILSDESIDSEALDDGLAIQLSPLGCVADGRTRFSGMTVEQRKIEGY